MCDGRMETGGWREWEDISVVFGYKGSVMKKKDWLYSWARLTLKLIG